MWDVVLGVVCLVILWMIAYSIWRDRREHAPKVIAHRGATERALENTLSAVRNALALDVPMIEIDVRRTRDDVLVLMHNRTVNHMTDGQGAIEDLTYSEINALNIADDEHVPTLEQVLNSITGHDAILVIEVKEPNRYPDMAQQLGALIDSAQIVKQCVVCSFDHRWLTEFSSLMPDITIGYLRVQTVFGGIKNGHVSSVYWLNVLLDPTLVRRVHSRDGELWVWTVNNTLLIRLLGWLGVDAIVTDCAENTLTMLR